MKITDKNIDVKNARYWSALNDKKLVTILKDICKKSTGKKQQLNESVILTIATIIGIGAGIALEWYYLSKGNEQQEKANKAGLDQQKLTDYKNGTTVIANPKTLQFDHEEVVKVVTNILAPTGSTVNVDVKDVETGEYYTHVADEFKVVDKKTEYVVRTVYNVLKNDNGGKEPTKEQLIQVMDDLKNGKKYLTTRAPTTGTDWSEFAADMKIVNAENFKKENGITDLESQCKIMSFDQSVNAWTINGQVMAKMPDPKKEIAATNQQLEKNPALKDTSSSKWPWILGIAAAAVGIPLLWSCLSNVTKEVKTQKLLAKCEFTCTGSNMTYCFGFNLKQMQWTLASKDNQKIGSEETSSFAKTNFAKKFADAVEIQMKNFYSENGSKPVYKAVEVAGKDKAELIKLLYDNKDKIESSLYNMTKCEAA